jgi:chitinase
MPYNYTVNYSTSASGPWTSAGTVSSPSDTISGLNPNTGYFFQITPIDTVSNIQGPTTVIGPFSTPLNPTAPGNPQLSGIQQNQVTLSWTPSV